MKTLFVRYNKNLFNDEFNKISFIKYLYQFNEIFDRIIFAPINNQNLIETDSFEQLELPQLLNFKFEISQFDFNNSMQINHNGSSFFILNFLFPNQFRRFSNAKNIGLFFWGADRFNPGLNYESFICLMDIMIAPEKTLFDLIKNKVNFDGQLIYLPLPTTNLDFYNIAKVEDFSYSFLVNKDWSSFEKIIYNSYSIIKILPLIKSKRFKIFKPIFDRLQFKRKQSNFDNNKKFTNFYAEVRLNTHDGVFILISEWLDFINKNTHNNQSDQARLFLKLLSPLEDTNLPSSILFFEFEKLIQEHLYSLGFDKVQIYVTNCNLLQLKNIDFIDAFISTALVQHNTELFKYLTYNKIPIIELGHEKTLSLFDPYGVYSLSTKWNLINPGELSTKLHTFNKSIINDIDYNSLNSTSKKYFDIFKDSICQ